MNKVPRDPRLFMGLGALGVVVGLGVLYMQYSGLAEQQDLVDKLRREVVAQRDVPEQLKASEADLTRIRAQLAHLERNVPDFAYVPTMLREVESVGKASGLQVVGIRPMDKTDAAKAEEAKGIKKPYEELDIEIRCRGSYGGILRFMNSLNAFPKIVAARAVSVEPKLDPLNPQAKPLLEVTARLRAFIFRDPAREKADRTAMAPSEVEHAG